MKPGNRQNVSVPIPAKYFGILKDEESACKFTPLHLKRFFILFYLLNKEE